jgi:hypothetical protein
VLHWSLTAFAVLLLIRVYFDFTTASQIETNSAGILWLEGPPSPERRQELALWHRNQAMSGLLYALGALMAGRAVRYVLSGE